MSEGTKFKQGQYFAWGSDLYLAIGDCEVWAGVMDGNMESVVTFDIAMDPAIAIKMLEAIGADSRYLMIGSDSGIDDDAPEDDEA